MTPVLAMTVVREAAIAAFVPEKFYTVALTLADGGTASSKRFAQKADAELLLSKCRKEGRVTVQKMERKEKSENPPPLYDLTALQRDANRLLGFTAQQTLDYAQSLYEKRLITYPRTDSRFLTEDMAASLPGLVTDTGRAFAVEEPFPIHVQQVINGSKVTDHHALLPTKSMANAFMKNKIIGVCPNCGANVVEREKGWFCESNPCRFVLWKDNAYFKRLGKRLDAHVADKLLRDGRVRLKDCKSAKGKNYNATVLLSCEADGRSKFSLEFEGGC